MLLIQDGRVKGHMFLSSYESTKIVTSYWTPIDRRMWELTKNRYLMSKDKEV